MLRRVMIRWMVSKLPFSFSFSVITVVPVDKGLTEGVTIRMIRLTGIDTKPTSADTHPPHPPQQSSTPCISQYPASPPTPFSAPSVTLSAQWYASSDGRHLGVDPRLRFWSGTMMLKKRRMMSQNRQVGHQAKVRTRLLAIFQDLQRGLEPSGSRGFRGVRRSLSSFLLRRTDRGGVCASESWKLCDTKNQSKKVRSERSSFMERVNPCHVTDERPNETVRS